MRRILAILPVLVAGILAASLAGAQPGIGVTKSTNLQGRGSSGSPLDLAPSIVVAVDITAGDDITATDRITTDKLYIPPSATSWLSVPFINLFPTLEPTALPAGATTDWFPTDFTWRSLIYVTPNAAGSTLSSIRENTSGDFRILINASTTASITLTHEHLASTDVKRISCPGAVDCTIPPGGTAFLVYAKQRYRVVGIGGAGDIEGVTAGNGLTGGGTAGTVTLDVAVGAGLSVAADAVNLNMAGASCVAGSYMSALTATGAGTCLAEVGDISNITAGNGLTGDTGTGAATLAVGCSTGITCAADAISVDTAAIQARVTGTCAAGSSIRVIDAAGAVTCETDDGGGVTDGDKGDITVTGTGTVWNIDADAVGAAEISAGAVGTSELADNLDLSANGSTTVGDHRGTITATTGSGTQHNWTAGGSTTTTTAIRVDTSAAALELTGLAIGNSDGREIELINAGPNLVSLYTEFGSSSAANRFACDSATGTIFLRSGSSMRWRYSSTSARWHCFFSGTFQNVEATGAITTATITASSTATFNGNVQLGDADTDVVWFTGYPSFDVNMKGIKDATPAPSLSANCGTGATASTGGNFAFTVTMGSAATSSCQVTFPDVFGSTPTCVVSSQSSARTDLYVSVLSTSSITVTNAAGANYVNGSKIDVICVGH